MSDFADHEQVIFCSDDKSGLKAIIAIHNSNLGPALGGCRMWPYATEEDAVRDVLRLSRGMTYKSALANLKLGGGKSVVIGNPRTQKTPALLEALACAIERAVSETKMSAQPGQQETSFGDAAIAIAERLRAFTARL